MLLLFTSCGAMSNSVDAVEVNVAKTDQYSRRDTVVVAGLDYNPETETHSELTGAVAGEMSKSGVQVNASDFSACHRNGKKLVVYIPPNMHKMKIRKTKFGSFWGRPV